jgi:glucose/arabinose dehydrogenase
VSGRARWIVIAVVLVLGASACTTTEVQVQQGPSPSATADPTPTTSEPSPTSSVASTEASGPVEPVARGDVVTGLAAPWSIAILSETAALVSLRDTGEVLVLSASGGGWTARSAGTVPGVVHQGEGGLLGLAVAPQGTAVYAMFTSGGDNRVVRMPWDGTRLGSPTVVLSGIPKGTIHNGGRLAFGPDGTLFVSTGDAGTPANAQNPASLAGKVLRINADGSIPADNPDPGSPMFSLGHRNVQGLAFDDQGRLWASEFGAKDVDEINRIEPGANYGWPLVEGVGGRAGLVDPVATWSPTAIASPSGIAYAAGSLWVATLRGRTLYEVPLAGGTAQQPIASFGGQFGRLRDVVAAEDGLWVLTNNTDGRGQPTSGDDRIIGVQLRPIG